MASWARKKKLDYLAKKAEDAAAARALEEKDAQPGRMTADYSGPPFVMVLARGAALANACGCTD